MTPQRNYITTTKIRVGESSSVKGSFWPEVLETAEKFELDMVHSQDDDICKATGWECPVDWRSVNALCQLHEVYVEEKRRHTMKQIAHPEYQRDTSPKER